MNPGYSNPAEWCAWRNRELADGSTGLLWMVGNDGRPFITDDEAVSAARRRREEASKEEERRRFNHRQRHPITEQENAV